eukprot:TRINITY_DN41485_c0_g1_i1.p1 TRINITY_DN41485_c0_g1~~TRINITY_DN41485_c0_g1_i1.p1  ORF type:complete len:412 (-),score=107.65 TRINITY_DN41485_c0_g1_i1:27-1229(-)
MSISEAEVTESEQGLGDVQLRKHAPTCQACGIAESRYRCPACDMRTCSAACVKAHKTVFGCTGKRSRAEMVAPLNAFTDNVLLRDYGLLEDVDSAVDRADRDLRLREEELRLHQPKRHRQRIALARACAAPERQTRLILAPSAMSLARENSSRLVGGDGKLAKGKGKGKGKKGKQQKGGDGKLQKGSDDVKPGYIAWRVDWHFGRSKQVLTDRSLAEHEVVGIALDRFLQNKCSWGATRHLLLPYAEAGLERLAVFLHQPPRAQAAAESDKGQDESGEKAEEHKEEEKKEVAVAQASEQELEVEAGCLLKPPPPPPPPPPSLFSTVQEESDEEESVDCEEEEEKAEDDAVDTEAKGPPFLRLDKSKTLRENLMARAIIEFPVLHVSLPEEIGLFDLSIGV